MNPTSQMKPRLLILALLFFFALTIGMSRNLAAADRAGTVPLQKVMVAYSSISGNKRPPLGDARERVFQKIRLGRPVSLD